MENLNSVDQMNGSIGKRAAELHSELEKLFAVELKVCINYHPFLYCILNFYVGLEG